VFEYNLNLLSFKLNKLEKFWQLNLNLFQKLELYILLKVEKYLLVILFLKNKELQKNNK
jgi:hypothetical protein